MGGKKIYLDYNATTPMKAQVRDLVVSLLDGPANPSSVHVFGREARKIVEAARHQVAKLVNAKPDEVIFTGSATEANNTFLKGCGAGRFLVSGIEHASIIKATAAQTEIIPVTPEGVTDIAALEKMLVAGTGKTVVCLMMVNNETGVIQPVKEAAALCKKYNAIFFCDAVQAVGRIPVDMQEIGIDAMSLAAHKIGGPQGVGALVLRKGIEVAPLLHGGSQEQGRRAGTSNVPGIAGFGKACELALADMPNYQALAKLRDGMEARIRTIAPEAVLFGSQSPRVANTSVICLPGTRSDTQMMTLDLDGIAVSSGSACSSGTVKPSHVLLALGATEDHATSSLRVSMGWTTTQEDIDAFLKSWEKMYARTKDKQLCHA